MRVASSSYNLKLEETLVPVLHPGSRPRPSVLQLLSIDSTHS